MGRSDRNSPSTGEAAGVSPVMSRDDLRARIHDIVAGLLLDVVVDSPKGEGLAKFMRDRVRPAILELMKLTEAGWTSLLQNPK